MNLNQSHYSVPGIFYPTSGGVNGGGIPGNGYCSGLGSSLADSLMTNGSHGGVVQRRGDETGGGEHYESASICYNVNGHTAGIQPRWRPNNYDHEGEY